MDYKEQKGKKADPQALAEAARTLQANRTGIVLTGRVRNGKVELDQSTLDDIARNFPNAEVSFVAVNAPFDPESRAIGDPE